MNSRRVLGTSSPPDRFWTWFWLGVVIAFSLFVLITRRPSPVKLEKTPRVMADDKKAQNENLPTSSPTFEDDWVNLSNGGRLHSLRGGDSSATNRIIILLHGANRQLQNADYWKPHYEWLTTLGVFYAVDMLGHGKSVLPHPQSASPEEQVNALLHFLEEKLPVHKKLTGKDPQVILIGRSYGGQIAMLLAKRMIASGVKSFQPQSIYTHSLAANILIAPAVDESLLNTMPKKVLNLPTLLFWAEDDSMIPFERSQIVIKHFPNGKVINPGKILDSPDKEKWRSHCPENEKEGMDLFHQEVSTLINSL